MKNRIGGHLVESARAGRVGPWPSEIQSRGETRMPLVKVKENESIDKAIRRFKKKCEKEGIIQDSKLIDPSLQA
jgi:hypothetical protein